MAAAISRRPVRDFVSALGGAAGLLEVGSMLLFCSMDG